VHTIRTRSYDLDHISDMTKRTFSVIPHAFGRNRPPTISTADMLKRELELVDALGDMVCSATSVPSHAD
jgi:poly [ADP-ribose] polymerase